MTLKTNRGRRRRDNGHPESISQQYCLCLVLSSCASQLLGGSSSSIFFLFHTFTDFRIYIKRQGYIYGGFQKGEEKRWKIFVMMMISLHFSFLGLIWLCGQSKKCSSSILRVFVYVLFEDMFFAHYTRLGISFFLLKRAGISGSPQWTSQIWSWARKQPKPPHIFVSVLKIYKLQRINHTSSLLI